MRGHPAAIRGCWFRGQLLDTSARDHSWTHALNWCLSVLCDLRNACTKSPAIHWNDAHLSAKLPMDELVVRKQSIIHRLRITFCTACCRHISRQGLLGGRKLGGSKPLQVHVFRATGPPAAFWHLWGCVVIHVCVRRRCVLAWVASRWATVMRGFA